jgi:hypothetical protein
METLKLRIESTLFFVFFVYQTFMFQLRWVQDKQV